MAGGIDRHRPRFCAPCISSLPPHFIGDWQHRKHDDHPDNQRKILLHDRQIPEEAAGDDEEADPENGAGHVMDCEFRVAHLGHAGHKGREGPHDRSEPRKHDRHLAVFLKELMRPGEMLRLDQPALVPDDRFAQVVACGVVDGIPGAVGE